MMLPEEIKQLAQEIAQLSRPKEWLSKEELMQEFGIKKSLLATLIKDHSDPLPYTTFGDKRQLFHRDDINKWLRKRMRNNFK